jgi:hypothetical protein
MVVALLMAVALMVVDRRWGVLQTVALLIHEAIGTGKIAAKVAGIGAAHLAVSKETGVGAPRAAAKVVPEIEKKAEVPEDVTARHKVISAIGVGQAAKVSTVGPRAAVIVSGRCVLMAPLYRRFLDGHSTHHQVRLDRANRRRHEASAPRINNRANVSASI